ncbi:MAG: tRNA (guanosine(46)-N7)-methyltransferase TrmB [Microcoleaceae cyanobacterium]
MARVRVRQHVNPFAIQYLKVVQPPEWQQIYQNLDQPLHIDIGCGRGRFLWQLAQLQPQWNFLGLEIREPLVTEANQWRDRANLTNLHYLFCNVNTSISKIFNSLPPKVIQRISIQFPDPWFKNRHQHRRMVQPELVNAIVTALVPGGEVFLQSDVEPLAEQMRHSFANHSALIPLSETWLTDNPFPISSEREKATLSRNKPVYRTRFYKNNDTNQKNES